MAFRDYVSDDMKGLYADPEDGRFRIGSSWWQEGGQTLDKFLQGNLQEVRISEGCLDKPKDAWIKASGLWRIRSSIWESTEAMKATL